MKVFIVGSAHYYASFIDGATLVDKLNEADIVLFTGGEDVSPEYYGAAPHPSTYSSKERDKREKAIFLESLKYDNIKLRLGICRGSQFLCVMSGGKLIQNVSHHAGRPHTIVNKEGEVLEITSTHHQMQYPFNLPEKEYEVLYWSEPKRSTIYEGDLIDPKKVIVEPEVVYYHQFKCLGIQGHPEMMGKESLTVKTLNNLIKNLL